MRWSVILRDAYDVANNVFILTDSSRAAALRTFSGGLKIMLLITQFIDL